MTMCKILDIVGQMSLVKSHILRGNQHNSHWVDYRGWCDGDYVEPREGESHGREGMCHTKRVERCPSASL